VIFGANCREDFLDFHLGEEVLYWFIPSRRTRRGVNLDDFYFKVRLTVPDVHPARMRFYFMISSGSFGAAFLCVILTQHVSCVCDLYLRIVVLIKNKPK
jgi:hypothetical protein